MTAPTEMTCVCEHTKAKHGATGECGAILAINDELCRCEAWTVTPAPRTPADAGREQQTLSKLLRTTELPVPDEDDEPLFDACGLDDARLLAEENELAAAPAAEPGTPDKGTTR